MKRAPRNLPNAARRSPMLLAALAIAGLGPLSCKKGNDTWIVVHVVSDPALSLNAVDMVVHSAASDADSGETKTAHFTDPANVSWSLFPGTASDKMFAVDIEARGLRNDSTDPVVAQRAVIAFQPGKQIEITMRLDLACMGVHCPGVLTCEQGSCVDPGVVGVRTGVDAGTVDAPSEASSEPDGGDARRDGASPDGDGAAEARRDAPGDGPLSPLGTSCAQDGECGSGHCVDGVCCNDACSGSCQQCDSAAMPGTCVAVAAGQPAPAKRAACARTDVSTCKQTGLCDGKGSCQLYADGQVCVAATCSPTANTLADSRCDGAGTCKAGTPLSCAPFRCQAGDAQCSRTCTTNADCDGQPCLAGSCGKLMVGSTCVADADCLLGFCVDSVCCNARCGGQCQSCNLSGSVGTCSNVKSGQPLGMRAACAGTGTCGGSCNGVSDCFYPDTTTSCRAASCVTSTLTAAANCNGAGICPAVSTSSCPSHLLCQAGTASCLAACATNGDCQPGFYCAGTSCTPTKANGTACVLGPECASGLCIDKVCCNAMCNGACQTCASAAAPGTCSKVAGVDDADTCTGSNTCNATGTCLKKAGQTCTLATECADGACADGHCCGSACTGSCQTCVTGTCSPVTNADDLDTCTGSSTCSGQGTCVAKQGQVCTTGGQCSSGLCVDGRCCNTTCTGACMSCVTGTCSLVTSTDDADTCTGTKTCSASGVCLAKPGQVCATGATCANGLCVDGHCCNTACTGSCQTCATGTCLPVMNGTDADTCTGTKICNASGTCLLAQGQTCTAGTDCATGQCVDGHCCNTACTGSCLTCATGTCLPVMNGTDADTCTGTKICNASGTCLLAQAQTCTAGTDCATGQCADGRCCDTACTGLCMTCNATATPGTCSKVVNGDDDTCTGSLTCNGSSVCLKKQGQSCAVGGDCANSTCVDTRCCNSTCTASCMTCNSSAAPGICSLVTSGDDNTCTGTMTCNGGGTCLLKAGQPCTTGTQCASTFCADGVCCNSACAGACLSCALAGGVGTCSGILAQDDPDKVACPGTCDAGGLCKSKRGQACSTTAGGCIAGSSCAPDGVCCTQTCAGAGTACVGSCSGRADGTCAYPTGGCGPAATCSGVNFLAQGSCNAGACITPSPAPCSNGTICSGNACKISCATNADCLPTYFCASGTCHQRATMIGGGYRHTCVLLADTTLRCWGDNTTGDLGNGTMTDSNVPIAVPNLSGVTAIASGLGAHTCVVMNDNTARCWGDNFFGSVGNGQNNVNQPTPVVVTGLKAVSAISVGNFHTCALIAGGTIQCWGYNASGQLGDGTTTDSAVPVPVFSINGAIAVAAGDSHTCALKSDGTVWCWGSNSIGQLGVTGVDSSLFAVQAPGVAGAVAIANGGKDTCVRLSSGAVSCWGINQAGEIGIGNLDPVPTPVSSPAFTGVTLLRASFNNMIGLTSGGLVIGAGDDSSGQLGNGSTAVANVSTAVTANGVTGAVALQVGVQHTCVLTPSGSAVCWGSNANSQLGNGTNISATLPVAVTPW
jgi:alpha-tubulin suppressor-like RCC1 family protein